LAGRGPRRELDEARQVVEARDDLLDAHERDVHAWERGADPDVPLVLDERDGTGLGDEEVGARDAHVGGEELLPERDARRGDERLGVTVERRAQALVEEAAAVVEAEVHHRRHDVARGLPEDLDDVLAQVGLAHADLEPLEVLVHPELLGEHAFCLHDRAHVVLADDAPKHRERIIRGLRPVHVGAVGLEVALGLLEVPIQVRERVRLRVAPPVPPPVRVDLGVRVVPVLVRAVGPL
jgi:hypothetical protein